LADNNQITKLDFLNGLMEKIKIYKKLKGERHKLVGVFGSVVTFVVVVLKKSLLLRFV
jgi:hypothetical protein